MKQWNRIFKKEGKVFTKLQEDIPRILKIFKNCDVKKILDLGCGSGRHVIYFAKNGFDVYGIDIAREGLKITNSELKKNKLKANLKYGSIYRKLPYADNFFDAVISTQAIHHDKIQEIRKVIKEIERVLRPNGLLFITVRKRKFREKYPKNVLIEKYGKQKATYKIIAPRTYIPIEGDEKGLVHYLFNKKLLQKEFKNFKIHDIWTDNMRLHYCLIGELKE